MLFYNGNKKEKKVRFSFVKNDKVKNYGIFSKSTNAKLITL